MSCPEEHLPRDFVQADVSWKNCRSRHPHSRSCPVATEHAACKSTCAGLPAPAPRTRPFPSHYQGSASAAESVAAHTSTAGAPRPRRHLVLNPGRQQKATFALLATEQCALPWRHRPYPPPGPQSGFCRQQAVAAGLYRYAGETGTCLAACGVCGRGANGDSWYHQAVRQRKSSRRCSPTDAHTCTCWIVRPQTARNPFGQADRSGSCSGSGAASSVFFGSGSQQSGYEAGFGAALALLAGNDAVAAGQGIRQCPGNPSQGYKYSGADAFCQGKMDAGHGRLLLAAWYLTLPTRPESRPAL